ncbi:MAG: hypothetical protein MJ102_06435 [Clostridia bacterium]|nr:hypothetical protein [Clostridia bacterium]
MTWEIVVGLISLVGSLIAVMNVVVRVNRTLTVLESAVGRLDETVRDQSAKNRAFFDRLGDHETRITLLEREQSA